MNKFLILHHSGIESEEPQYGSINEYHKRKKFPMSSLGKHGGYTWLIEQSGERRQYRREDEMGAHTKGYNDNIAICMAGDFRYQKPTGKQLDTLKKLSMEIVKRWNISLENIIEHRDVSVTVCPAWDFKGYVVGYLKASGNDFAPSGLSDKELRAKALSRQLQRLQGKVVDALQMNTIRRKLKRLTA